MSTKHFYDGDAATLVRDCLESLTAQNPELVFDRKQKAIFHAKHDPSICVGLVSGGGAGHEPAHAAYVGEGMLAAAVSGNIFASPSVMQIVATMRQIAGSAGTILIVKNYTGDVFHFHLAAEKARASFGLNVEVVVVGDDVSVGRKKGGKVGRRGLAGTVLVHKILGATSAIYKKSLEDTVRMGKKVAANLVTVGVSLDHVHVPGQPAEAHQHLHNDQIELGMGIHNEPGCYLLRPRPSLDALLETMFAQLLNMDDTDRGFVDFSNADEVVLLVNNLGSLSVLELFAITTQAVRKLDSRGIKPARTLSGTFMTSLDGPGFSITLLKADVEMLACLDAPTTAVGWCAPTFAPEAWKNRVDANLSLDEIVQETNGVSEKGPKFDLSLFKSAVTQSCERGIAVEPDITKSDTIVGDGDCGITLKRGCESILASLTDSESSFSSSAVHNLLEVADLLEKSMDGTSGAIYGLYFNGLAAALRKLPESMSNMDIGAWATVTTMALETLKQATPARVGDRTLIDALEPFVLGVKDGLETAVKAARKGMESTKGMTPAFGRAVYVAEKGWDQVPDPGAQGVVALVEGILSGLR